MIFLERINDFNCYNFDKDWGGQRIEGMKDDLFQEIESMNQDRNNIFESVEASCCVASKKYGFVIDPDLKFINVIIIFKKKRI